jgi:hypothetical protein
LTETNDSIAAVGELIQERRKYEGWLAALEARQGQTPQHVYERVKADYETRLHEAIEKIGAHTEALSQREEALTARLAEMAEIEQRRVDERAEAELRAHVGEITAEAWDASAGEIDSALAGLAEERSVIERDISDVREMLAAARPRQPADLGSEPPADGSLAPRSAESGGERPTRNQADELAGQAGALPQPGDTEAAVAADAAAPSGPDRTSSAGSKATSPSTDDMEIPIEAPGARATPGYGAEAQRRSGPVDLADLPIHVPADHPDSAPAHPQLELPTGEHEVGRPAAEDQSASSAPSGVQPPGRAAGASPRRDSFDELAFLKTVTGIAPPDATRAPAAPHRPEPRSSGASAPSDPFPTAPRAPVRSSAPVQHDESESALRGVDPKPSKTLKCSECGSMNYPTEWYCERCGAELAAL